MTRKRIFNLFLIIAVCAASNAWAQALKITGRVTDENNAAVPFANIVLFNRADSTMVGGVVSDDLGAFELSTVAGDYSMRITFLSFEEKVISPIAVRDQSIDLGTIQLKSGVKTLESVTIEGEKSQMELHLDKRVFEVAKDLSNIGGSASDILDNVPSVSVDVDGNVSLRGSGNVRILIDGRPSGLTGISTADALQQLQGNLIERIEVITNPSARYDAEGEVGIINIILKKEKNKGVNGSATLNAGYPNNYGASFNLNFRRNKVNYFASYGISYRKSPGRGSSFQSFRREDSVFFYRQFIDRERSDLSHNIRGGVDVRLSNSQTLTGTVIVRTSESVNTTRNEYQDLDEDFNLINTIVRNEREKEPELNTEFALAYKKDFSTKGRSLTADLKWIESWEDENATFDQTDLSKDSTGYQRSANTENERNLLAQIDYVQTFKEKGKFETGLKGTTRVLNNIFLVEQLDVENTNWVSNTSLNNDLIYTENIYAAYFIVGNEFKKIGWQAGLRGELSDIQVELEKTNEQSTQNYFNLFPSVHLSYSLSQHKTLQLSYSYRVSRPRFRDLMPFSNFSDNRSIEIGNPNLRPEYTNSIEAGYLLNWEKGSLLSSAYYRYRTGVIEDIALVDSIGFSRRFPVNLGVENAYGLEFNLSFSPVEVWKINANANFYRATTDGKFNDQDFYSDTYTWTSRTTSKITLFKKWDFQTGFNYRGPRQTPQGRDLSLYFIDLGLSRRLMKGNGTLTMSVRDLLNSRKFRSVIDRPDEGYYSTREFQGRLRQFLLTFTYRINPRASKGENDREDDGDDGEFDGED